MSAPLNQHQAKIERSRQVWQTKPLLRRIYEEFYKRILSLVNLDIPGRIIEIGSGTGNLRRHLPQALGTDLFPNPWLDIVCDGYELPFAEGSLSHLILFDVFHHLATPNAFLEEARRVLAPSGRLILFEPFISLASLPVYGILHHEPVALRREIDLSAAPPLRRDYYAAQGNATRLFFRREIPNWPQGWKVFHSEAFSCFGYLLSGGYSKPAMYPADWLQCWQRLDAWLSRWPKLFAGRCLVGLNPADLVR